MPVGIFGWSCHRYLVSFLQCAKVLYCQELYGKRTLFIYRNKFVIVVYQHILLAFFWILFGVLHSWLASLGVKEKLKTILKRKFKHYRIYYTVFAFLTMISILIYQVSIPSPSLFKASLLSNSIGAVVCLSGLIIMAICIKKYFFSLSGLKELVTEHPGNELIITGIHRYIRHPLYLGTFLFIWGLLVMFPLLSLLIAVVIITIYTLIGISFEESKLEAEFGESYRRYKASVPKLIPFL